MSKEYFKQRDKKNMNVVDEHCSTLPQLCTEYFDDISLARAASTMANYARQLSIFFNWVVDNLEFDKPSKDLTADDIASITTDDITSFLHSLKFAGNSDETIRAYARAVSAFYSHFVRKNKLKANPVDGVLRPKHKKSPKIYLDDTDNSQFLDSVTNKTGLTDRQVVYNNTINAGLRTVLLLNYCVTQESEYQSLSVLI